jgi:hypothetical protein
MKNFIAFFIFISVVGCNQQDHQTTKTAFHSTDSASAGNSNLPDTLPKSLSPNDTLLFNLTMDTNRHVTIPIKVSTGKELFASLSSNDKKANIRVSQIEFPDSTFDGPFGRELHYQLKTHGNYKLIIGEDMMAGDRWQGDFVLKVWVR